MMLMLSLFTFIKNNGKLLFAITVIFLWSFGWYMQGRRDIQEKWDGSIVAAKSAAVEIEHNNTKTAFEIGSGYEKTRIDIDNSFNGYINGLQPTSADLSAESNPASKSNVATCRNSISQKNKRAFLELAKQAELNTQKLIALQSWIFEIE